MPTPQGALGNTASHDVFISYSSQDDEAANEVAQALEATGIRCWIAGRDVPLGTANWAADIERAIRQARAMVLLVSPDFNRSVQTPKEIILGIDQNLRILPILITKFQPWGHLRYFLADIQWFDASGENLTERLSPIAEVLRIFLARGPRTKDPDYLSKTEASGLQPAKALGILPPRVFLKLGLESGRG